MGFFKTLGKKQTIMAEEYIDLSEWMTEEVPAEDKFKMTVKIAEIYRYEDLSDLTGHVYNGNMLVLDYSPIASDEFVLKRVTNELKQLTQDINGDVAGVGKNMLVVTPNGVKIDRRKVRGKL